MSLNRQAWDGDAHRDLLIATFDVLSPSGELIRKIVERATEMGYNYTPKAVIQHLQKLRRSANDGTASPKTPKTQATPRTPKSKANGKLSAKATTNKRKKVKSDSEDETAFETPTKKPHFAAEDGDSDDLEVKKEIVSDEKSINFGGA